MGQNGKSQSGRAEKEDLAYVPLAGKNDLTAPHIFLFKRIMTIFACL
jgi:hypothetical protein